MLMLAALAAVAPVATVVLVFGLRALAAVVLLADGPNRRLRSLIRCWRHGRCRRQRGRRRRPRI
jgi:hypothetical protein